MDAGSLTQNNFVFYSRLKNAYERKDAISNETEKVYKNEYDKQKNIAL